MLKYNFIGKTILVTAGSKGIGFELAKQLSLLGANVAICSRNETNLKFAKANILNIKNDAKIFTIKYDLQNTKKLESIFLKTKNFFKSNIDILINNSGGPPPKMIMETRHLQML